MEPPDFGDARALVIVYGDDWRRFAKYIPEGSAYVQGVDREAGERAAELAKGPVIRSLSQLLGTEHRYVVVDAYRSMRPNVVAAAAETVVRGGVLILLVGRPGRWRPGFRHGTGAFAEYMWRRFEEAEPSVLIDADAGSIRVRGSRTVLPRPSRTQRILPSPLDEMCVTDDQARFVAEALKLAEGRSGILVGLGDRGRGKSGALGIVAAELLRRGFDISVTAPSLDSVQSMFRVAIRVLEALGVGYEARREGSHVTGLSVGGAELSYVEPHRAVRTSILLVDEAAAVGVARLRRYAQHVKKLIAASTVHGYEGSGHALTQVLLRELRPVVIRLETPIRYAPGDPLERWLYRAFLLDVEPPQVY